MTEITDDELKKMRMCSNLLAPPAPEVVKSLVDTLLQSRQDNAALRTQLNWSIENSNTQLEKIHITNTELREKLIATESKYRDAMEQLASACERADEERIPDDVLQTIIEFMDRPTAQSRRNAQRTNDWLAGVISARKEEKSTEVEK